MNNVIKNPSKAVCVTSMCNPIMLIASLENFKSICPNYTLYVCLNPQRENITIERFNKTISFTYRIIKHYEKYFKEIKVLELNHSGKRESWQGDAWISHGTCIDTIINVTTEQQLAIFEEDAFIFDKKLFESWFDKLNQGYHIFCGANYEIPNNSDIFDRLSMFDSVPDNASGPGKESIFFIDKKIMKYMDWWSTDYISFNENKKYKLLLSNIPSKLEIPLSEDIEITTKYHEITSLKFKNQISFDTFEFFTFRIFLDNNIKCDFYKEIDFDYWWLQGTGKNYKFYQIHTDDEKYVHYFNSSLYSLLSVNNPKNFNKFKKTIFTAEDWGPYVQHLSTYVIYLALLFKFRKKFIELLGLKEYKKYRNCLKRYIFLLVQYYGYGRILLEFKYHKFVPFVYRYIMKHHIQINDQDVPIKIDNTKNAKLERFLNLQEYLINTQ